MKEYFLKSIITALVFIGITIAFDAIFDKIDIIWKYLINRAIRLSLRRMVAFLSKGCFLQREDIVPFQEKRFKQINSSFTII